MTDYQLMSNLFVDAPKLEKFTNKRWVKIHPINNNYGGALGVGNTTPAILYNCKNVKDKLVNYHDGFILVEFSVTGNAGEITAAKFISPKSSNAFINQSIVRINNQEVDNQRDHSIFMDILNAFETPKDFAVIEQENLFVYNDYDLVGDAMLSVPTHKIRNNLSVTATANNTVTGTVKIPLKYVSTLFRALDFPVINNEFEFEITYTSNSIYSAAGVTGITLTITKTELYLPIVELPSAYQLKLAEQLASGVVRTVVWEKLDRVKRQLAAANAVFNEEVFSSINGIRKLVVFVKDPVANADIIRNFDSTSTITLTNANIVIDSEDYYQQDVVNDQEHYLLTKELFNMQGKEPNSGAVFSYASFKNRNRYYGYDLSRQKVFETNPRKPQSIRYRGTFNNAANASAYFFGFKEATLVIDMASPFNTKLI